MQNICLHDGHKDTLSYPWSFLTAGLYTTGHRFCKKKNYTVVLGVTAQCVSIVDLSPVCMVPNTVSFGFTLFLFYQ